MLAYKVDRLLDDRERLAAMRANVRRIARPRAAYDVVSQLVTFAHDDSQPQSASDPP